MNIIAANTFTKNIARHILVLQKNSPKILFVGGIAGVVTSSVMACKATLKLGDIVDETENLVSDIKEDLKDTESYKSDLAYVYFDGAYKIVKLYAPAVIIGAASIGALTGSHVTLTRRNAGLTAAYGLVSKSFDEYRSRVSSQIGADKEKDIYHSVSVVEKLDENNKIKTVSSADPNKWSPYARFFDETSQNWQKNAELNRIFVQAQQNYANHLLHARGHIFLNEVYDMLGLERSSAGQVVGWVTGNDGDNFIDFGLFEAHNARFVNGWERSIILDFNVDGVIYDKI